MQAKAVFVCLYVCLSIWEIDGQVGTICRPKERLLDCGCHKSCRSPAPDCAGVCKPGCFCEDGEVRDDDGNCVKLEDCPLLISHLKELDTTEPRNNAGLCPENEEYKYCEPCNRTCDTPNPVCPAQCGRGCFCKGYLLRDINGKCVEWGQCSNILKHIQKMENDKAPVPARFSCGPNKVYTSCQRCIKTCGTSEPVCDENKCRSGCVCKDHLFQNSDGKCITEAECDYEANKEKFIELMKIRRYRN